MSSLVSKLNLTSEREPWYNRDEFCKVASALFSDDIDERNWGLGKIEVWRLRSFSAFPACVEVTAFLVRSNLQEDVFLYRNNFCDNNHIQQMHAQAIVRFTNLAERLIKTPEKGITQHEAARKLEIPEWIVNLGNSCTHSSMPDLSDLRCGVSFLLDYMKREYWDVMVADYRTPTIIEPFQPQTVRKVRICNYLKEFKHRRLLHPSKVFLLIRNCFSEIADSMKLILHQLQEFIIEEPKTFLDILIKPELFLMLPQDLPIILQGEPFLNDGTLNLPKSVILFWASIIDIINRTYKIPEFVISLMEHQKNLQPFHQKVACSWILKLIEAAVYEGGKAADPSDPIYCIYQDQPWVFNWFKLVHHCALNPSMSTPGILPLLFDQVYPPLSEDTKVGIVTAICIKLGTITLDHDLPEPPTKLLTLSDVKENMCRDFEEKYGGDPPPSKKVWNLCTEDIDWSTIPLGHVLSNEEEFIGAPSKVKNDSVEKGAASNLTSNGSQGQSQNDQSAANDPLPPADSTSDDIPWDARPAVPPDFIMTEDDFY